MVLIRPICVQEEGVLFLPFEQRMTRDINSFRERRQARREMAATSGKSSRAGHAGMQPF